MNAVCIIPARGGSVRIPRKNIKLFHGNAIIAYSIETAKAAGLFYRIIVSTDDDEIEAVARSYGACVVRRPACDGSMGTQDVARMALADWDCDDACCLYATSPLVTVADLTAGKAALWGRQFAMSVADPLADAGAFYWGKRQAFMDRLPLIAPHTAMVPILACDINTMDDWTRAEQLYKDKHDRNL